MKKIVSCILALVMVLSMASVAAADEPLHLSVFGRQRSGITFEQTQNVHAWQVLCDMFAANHLELDYTIAERDQYASVLNATLSNGNVPDFFLAATLTDADCIYLIENGLLMDINEALQYSNGPAAKEFAEGGLYAESTRMHTYTDGGMYFFGNISKQISVENETFGPNAVIGNNACMLIRQDWLDKLGLAMPTTTDELIDVLVAFQENDMNGNGLKDERIVIDWDTTLNGVASWFGLAPFDFQVNRETKQAVVPMLQEGYVPYVKFLQKLVDMKLAYLSDDVSYYNGGTSEGDQLSNSMQSDAVAAYYGVALADHAFQSADAVYTIMPNIQGVEGIEPVMNASSGYKVWSKWAFSAKADPKAVAAFLDTICTQEYAKWVTFGVEGETYTVDPDSGLYTFTASNKIDDVLATNIARSYVLVIDSYLPDASQIGWYQSYYGPLNWSSYDEFLNSAYMKESITNSYSANQISNLTTWCKQASESLLYNFNPDIGMITPMNTLDEADVLDMYEVELKTYLSEITTNFLTGLYDISNYDQYVEEAKSMGLEEVLAVRQAQYNRYYGIE